MKIADYVSKYLKESYDEPKGIENEEDAKKAIEDLKDFFEMGEDEENEFGDDLDKMLMAMDSGEEVDDLDLDDLDLDDLDIDEGRTRKGGNGMDGYEEGKDSKKDCPGCKTTKVEKYCPDCGTKNEGDDLEERKYDLDKRGMSDEDAKKFDDGVKSYMAKKGPKEEGYGLEKREKRDYDEGDSFSDMVKRSGHSDGYDDDDDDDEYDEDGIPKYPDPMRGRTRPGSRRGLYSSKNYKMTEMEKKLEEYREGKKNKKGHKTKGVVDADDSSDSE